MFKEDYDRLTRRVLILETIILKKFGKSAVLEGEKVIDLLEKNITQLRTISPFSIQSRKGRKRKITRASSFNDDDSFITSEADGDEDDKDQFSGTLEEDRKGDNQDMDFISPRYEDSDLEGSRETSSSVEVACSRSGRKIRPRFKLAKVITKPSPKKDAEPDDKKAKTEKQQPKPRKRVRRVVCDVCGVSVLRNNFKHHQTTHELIHICKTCGKGFSTEFALKSHEDHAHDLDKPYMCNHPDCESRFNTLTNLRSHLVRHTEERKYQCELCNHSYKHKGGLAVHINSSHSKLKQFPCPICSSEEKRIFDTRTHLKRHITKVHNLSYEEADQMTIGMKQPKEIKKKNIIVCEFCSKQFKTTYYLKLHQNAAHTREEEFPCSICLKIFYRKNHLKRHLEKVHGEVERNDETASIHPDESDKNENLEYEEVELGDGIEIVEIQEIPDSQEDGHTILYMKS